MKELAVGTFDETKTNTVTLINLGEQIAAFMDGQIVYTILSARGMGSGVQNYFCGGWHNRVRIRQLQTVGSERGGFQPLSQPERYSD